MQEREEGGCCADVGEFLSDGPVRVAEIYLYEDAFVAGGGCEVVVGLVDEFAGCAGRACEEDDGTAVFGGFEEAFDVSEGGYVVYFAGVSCCYGGRGVGDGLSDLCSVGGGTSWSNLRLWGYWGLRDGSHHCIELRLQHLTKGRIENCLRERCDVWWYTSSNEKHGEIIGAGRG